MKRSRINFDGVSAGDVEQKRQKLKHIGDALPIQPKSGTAFFEGISKLASGRSDKSVRANLNISYKLPSMKDYHEHSVDGTISVMSEGNRTQSMLHPMGMTSYFKNGQPNVLPKDLSLSRAQLEGKVIKRLSPNGETYDPNSTYTNLKGDNGELTIGGGKKYAARSPVGGIALGSFLEDVTAQRSVGLAHVGSAMRAELMAKKWTMQNEGKGKSLDFATDMLSKFPQLGKEEMKSGIARMKKDWDSGTDKPVITKKKQRENIFDAHQSARQAASERFQKKFEAIADARKKDRSTVIEDKGKWWVDNAAKIDRKITKWSDPNTSDASRQRSQQKFSQEYVHRKLDRHGINR